MLQKTDCPALVLSSCEGTTKIEGKSIRKARLLEVLKLTGRGKSKWVMDVLYVNSSFRKHSWLVIQ